MFDLQATFPKKCFCISFGGNVKFLHNMQKKCISDAVQDRAILANFLALSVFVESSGSFSQSHLPTILESHLEF